MHLTISSFNSFQVSKHLQRRKKTNKQLFMKVNLTVPVIKESS